MIHYEDLEQQALFQWAAYQPCGTGKIADFLVHIPNGGRRNPVEAARMTSLGVKPGVSDLFFCQARLSYHGLWVEMKRQLRHFRGPAESKSAVTTAQLDWIGAMQRHGYAACVCYGSEEAQRVIAGYACGDRQQFHVQYDICLHRFHKTGLTA